MSPSYEVLRRALRLQWYPCQQLMAWVQSWEYVTWTPLKTLLQESKAPTLSKPSSRWKADKEEKLFQIESVLTGKTAKYNMFSGIGSRIKEERERGRDLAKVGCGLWIRQLYCTGVDSLFGDLWVAFRCVVVFMKYTLEDLGLLGHHLCNWLSKHFKNRLMTMDCGWCSKHRKMLTFEESGWKRYSNSFTCSDSSPVSLRLFGNNITKFLKVFSLYW